MSDLRHRLFELSAAQALEADLALRLHRLAGLVAPESEPAQLAARLPRGLAVLAAALLGLGLLMWVAANWDDFGRAGRFALLQGLVLLAGLAAGQRRWRGPWQGATGLMALLGTGGLLAYFGQTYQTGADAWQLFALWAGLSLPLALGLRSDIVWAPWALVAVLAVVLWVQTHTGHRWRVEAADLPTHLLGFGSMLLLCLGLSPWLQRWTGAGSWALRTAVSLAVLGLVCAALGGLFFSLHVQLQYGVGLAVLALAAALLCTHRGFEIFALSAVALGLNALLVAGLARWLFTDRSRHGDPIFEMLMLGLLAAGLLAASVSLIMRLARREELAR